jgi:pre-mRNA-splicing factor SYF1
MREMLRIKRSVQATYNTQVNMMAAQIPTSSETQAKTAMQALEAKAAESNYKQTLTSATAGANIMFVRGEVVGGKYLFFEIIF